MSATSGTEISSSSSSEEHTLPRPSGRGSVFLVGPMGAGKSAVGRQLSRLLKLPFIDADQELERRTGVDIPTIFEKEGETGFRARERELLAELTLAEPKVLSTGGGAILDPANRSVLRERGTVVYLQTSVAVQAARVRGGRHRPLLAGGDVERKLGELMQHRAPLYESTAHLIVTTDHRRVRAVAEEISRALDAAGSVPRAE